jgi:hypothetical protein
MATDSAAIFVVMNALETLCRPLAPEEAVRLLALVLLIYAHSADMTAADIYKMVEPWWDPEIEAG